LEAGSSAAIASGPPTSPNQDDVAEDQRTGMDRDAANDPAVITDRENSAAQASFSLTESFESAVRCHLGDEMTANRGDATNDPGQVKSSSTPPSQREISLQDQSEPSPAQADEHRRLARRRVKKLARTMNRLLGESGDDEETGAQSSS
jgi:hypothetical protein